MTVVSPLISVKDVSLTYEGFGFFSKKPFTALRGLTFDIDRGETFGVVGRNGCGKSTLLQVLADIIKPSTGTVETDKGIKRALLSLGLGFNKQLSGRDNAVLSLMLQGASRSEAIACLQVIKDFSELGAFFERPVKTYSSGMRSRLGFATALESKVDLLLIDETLSVGDKSFNKKAEDAMLTRISGEQTVVFVSHNADQVERLCTRSLWLERGEVRCVGPSQEVAAEYNSFMTELRHGAPKNRGFG